MLKQQDAFKEDFYDRYNFNEEREKELQYIKAESEELLQDLINELND